MTSLYHLSAEMQDLLNLAQDADEDFAAALADTIGAQSEMIDEKIEATMQVARSLEADAEACKAEAKRLNDRAKRLQGNADSCKQRVIEVMQASGKASIKRPLMTVTLAKPRQVVCIADPDKVPEQYTKLIPASRQPIKADIQRALKAGNEVPGCTLEDGAPSLRIS